MWFYIVNSQNQHNKLDELQLVVARMRHPRMTYHSPSGLKGIETARLAFVEALD